jgi:hypothetical protein
MYLQTLLEQMISDYNVAPNSYLILGPVHFVALLLVNVQGRGLSIILNKNHD